MAIDSRQKRMSMMSFGQHIRFLPMWESDGTIDADDEYHQLNLYSGITLDGAPAVELNYYHKIIGVGK